MLLISSSADWTLNDWIAATAKQFNCAESSIQEPRICREWKDVGTRESNLAKKNRKLLWK